MQIQVNYRAKTILLKFLCRKIDFKAYIGKKNSRQLWDQDKLCEMKSICDKINLAQCVAFARVSIGHVRVGRQAVRRATSCVLA